MKNDPQKIKSNSADYSGSKYKLYPKGDVDNIHDTKEEMQKRRD